MRIPSSLHLNCSVPGDPPGDFQAAVVTARTCLLTWDPPTIPNGVLLSHTITYNLTSDRGGGLATLVVGGGDTSTLVTDLHPYEYYQFTVFASTRIGSSPLSVVVTVRTQEASKLRLCKKRLWSHSQT